MPSNCFKLLILAALGAAVQARPSDDNIQWTLRHSSQVAQPVVVNSAPVSDEFPIPRFAFPAAASRRQDAPWPSHNNLQSDSAPAQPVHVRPGDTVSLIVRGRNPLEPQPFVDVTSLLAELQKANAPVAADGAYHVFLAPPDFPPPKDGQKFDVTYVGQPPSSHSVDSGRNSNSHPPLFVAPLDYSVPHGYGRIQIPTRQVKFALPTGQVQQQPQTPQPQFGGFQPIQQEQQQQFQPPPPQFRQPEFQPPPPQFRQPEFQPPPPQFRQPEVIHQQAPPPPPPPTQFRQEVNQFQPPPPQFRQPQPPPQVFQPLPPPQQEPSLFDQALKDLRTVPAAPQQQLEEEALPARPVEIPQPELRPFGREPVVLAVDRPAFLEPEPVPVAPAQVPVAIVQEVPQTTSAPPTTVAPTTTSAPVPTTTAPSSGKRRPSSLSTSSEGSFQLPDFHNARRQQLNRQQQQNKNNRQKITRPAENISPSAFERRPSSFGPENAAGEITFGQKIRPKVKTNALVSPPVTATSTSAPLVADSQRQFEADPPLVERDEAFQTLESQNSGPSQRGRVRFSRPDVVSGSANAIQAEVKTTAAPTTAAPTTSSGRGRLRATTTTVVVPTTAAPTTTEAPTTTQEVTTEKVLLTTTTEEPEEEVEEAVQEEEEQQQQAVSQPPVTTTTARNNINDKPWSPYEAIQRQRQTSDSDKQRQAVPATPSDESSSKPARIRGSTKFSSSRPTNNPPVRVERPVVLRPLARQPTTSVPVVVRQKDANRNQEDFIAPVAPEFGIRGDISSKPSVNPVQQSLLPVGRRVPEIRPVAGQTVRISSGRQPAIVVVDTPTSTEAPEANDFEGEEQEEEEAEEAEEEPVAGDDEQPEEDQDAEEEEQANKEQEESGADEAVSSSTIATDAVAATTEASGSSETVTTTTESTTTTSAQEVESASGNKLDDPSSVLGVSTATEVSLMYELCYRGRCVRVHE